MVMINETQEVSLESTEQPIVASEEVVQQTTSDLIQQAQQNMKPEQAAELVYRYYWPRYRMLVSHLSNKDSRRLNEAVVGYPLEVTNKNFFSKEAKEAFDVAKTLLDAKFILQQKVLSDRIKELEVTESAKMVDKVNNETVTEGETNV